jgi:hypothetical protein
LQQYEEELIKAVLYIRDLEKFPIYIDEEKVGFNYFTVELEAY